MHPNFKKMYTYVCELCTESCPFVKFLESSVCTVKFLEKHAQPMCVGPLLQTHQSQGGIPLEPFLGVSMDTCVHVRRFVA